MAKPSERGLRSLLAGFLFLIATASLLPQAAPSRPLTWCTNPLYPPYDWAVGPEAYAGASVDLFKVLMPAEVPTRILVVPWIRAQALAAEGQVDLLMGIRITPERQRYLEFSSVPVFPNPIVIWARRDKTWTFSTWADLKGRLGGTSRGDFFGAAFDDYLRKELRTEEAPTMKENFQKLAAGRIEWFVSGYYLGLSWVQSNPEGKDLVSLEPAVTTEGIYLAMAKNSPWLYLLPKLDARLREAQASGLPVRLLQESLRRYVASQGQTYTP